MRIVKRGGSSPGIRIFEGECLACGAIMEEEERNLKITDTVNGRSARANCPMCHRKFTLRSTRRFAIVPLHEKEDA